MPRFRVSLFALAPLVATTAAIPQSSGAQEATSAGTPATTPQPPPQPTTGPGSSEALFGGVTAMEQIPAGQPQADYWLFVPADPLPGTTQAGKPLPLVILIGGTGASNADGYLAWIEHLVQRGAVVVFPLYEHGPSDSEPAWQQPLLDDVRRALETLEQEGVPVDLSRVAVVGHSIGAEMALVYAASAAEAGFPAPTAVMSIVPVAIRSRSAAWAWIWAPSRRRLASCW